MIAKPTSRRISGARLARQLACLALGFAAFCGLSPVASAATFQCSANLATSGPGFNNNSSGATECLASAVDGALPLVTAQSYGGDARSEAGHGIVRGLSSIGSADAVGNGFFLLASQISTITDRFVISGLTGSNTVLRFAIALDGIMLAQASALNSGFAPTASSGFEFRYSVSRGSTSLATGIADGCAASLNPGISVCNGNFTFGPNSLVFVSLGIPVSFAANNGDAIDLSLELTTRAFGRIGQVGDVAEAYADFSHTVAWQGLVPDPAYAGVTLTSESGFDYGLSRVPSSTVPVPGSLSLMLVGLGFLTRRQGVGKPRAPQASDTART